MKPLLGEDGINPVKVTAGIFQFLKDNSDLCIVTLGPYGDKLFLLKLLNIGRQTCMEGYAKYFEKASPKKLEYYYAFASMGCIGLLQNGWMRECGSCGGDCAGCGGIYDGRLGVSKITGLYINRAVCSGNQCFF